MMKFLSYILDIGVKEALTRDDVKGLRVLNGICFFVSGLLILTGFIAIWILKPSNMPTLDVWANLFSIDNELAKQASKSVIIYIPLLDFLLAGVLLLVLLFNYYGKYKIGVFVAAFAAQFATGVLYLIFGAVAGFFMLMSGIVPIVFLKKQTTYRLIWFSNVVVFYSISFYLNTVGGITKIPLFYDLNGQLIHHTIGFVILYFVVLHFKRQNQRNESVLLNQAEEITVQRDELLVINDRIAQQSHDIISSIESAQRIQSAILPSKKVFSAYFKDSFILYEPRDIVSGDFYWIEKFEGKTVVVVADCTGHGVPGAFMSMLGVSLLNEVVPLYLEYGAGVVLDKLRERIKSTLGQSNDFGKSKEGMDLALCVIDMDNYAMEFGGANCPIYIIRNKVNTFNLKSVGEHLVVKGKSKNLLEIKPDRQPISIHLKESPFSTRYLKLEAGDLIYLFSDGFSDQLGGKVERKYYSKFFKRDLLKISDQRLEEQNMALAEMLENWKGKRQQVDDVLIVGIQV